MSAQASLRIRTLFAPFDNTTQAFLAFVKSAQKSIHINIYGFHLPPLTDLLISAHERGLTVDVILDHTQAEGKAEASEVQKLVDAGVPLLIGTSPVHGAILHSKFCVVDAKSVEFGSWNYSLSASQQSNDMHFIEDQPVYAAEYLRHHDRILSFIALHEMACQPRGEVVPKALGVAA
jgi:phosphatidylserine/phosphatidylglycerophosphate/cardiolipin synthase-like enzyme